MTAYYKKRRSNRKWLVVLLIAMGVIGVGIWGAHKWYDRNLGPVDSSSTKTVSFTVIKGSSVHEIGVDLNRARLIRSTQAFEAYDRAENIFINLKDSAGYISIDRKSVV